MEPVVVTARFVSAPGAHDDLLRALLDAIPEVHEEEGCLLYAVHEADDGSIIFIEKWASRESLQAHAEGEPVRRLNASVEPFVSAPPVVLTMTGRPAGGAAGVI